MEGDSGDRSKVLAYHSVLCARIPHTPDHLGASHRREGYHSARARQVLHVVSNYASFSDFASMEGVGINF